MDGEPRGEMPDRRQFAAFALGAVLCFSGATLSLGAHGLATEWRAEVIRADKAPEQRVRIGSTDPDKVRFYEMVGIVCLSSGLIMALAAFAWVGASSKSQPR